MKKKVLKIILKSLLIVIILASIAIGVYFILRACGFTTAEQFIGLRDRLGESIWFWLIIALLQIVQVIFIPVSNQIITIPLALIFPTNELWKVWLCSWLAIWVATLILYVIGRLGGKKLLGWLLSDKEQAEKCANWLKRGWVFYPLGMLLPLPDDIITILAGTSKMNIWFVIGCSLLTRAVDSACSVFGFGILTKYAWGWLLLALGIILLVVATIIFWKIERKRNVQIHSKHK